jgi:type IV pilus assembly protein PilO
MAKESPLAKINTLIDERYVPLDKKIKIGAALVLLIAPCVLFYLFFWQPQQEEITKLENQKKTLTDDVERAEKAAANMDQHEKELADAEEFFREVADIFPSEQEIPDLLRRISDLGKRAGLDFVTFRPSPEVQKDFYAEIPIHIEIRGPYHNVGYFLGEVSMLDRLVTVDNIQMRSPKEEGGEVILNSTCTLLTYRFTNQETAPAKK